MDQFIKMLLLLIAVWNLWVFLLMGLDKRRAVRGRRRISERTLLLSALFFGSFGGFLGMRVFHHKTLHNRFRCGLPVMMLLHALLLLGGAYLLLTF